MLCLLLLSIAGLSVAAQDEKGFVRINPEDVQWKDAPVKGSADCEHRG